MRSRIPLLLLILLIVIGGSWLLKQEKKKEDPRIAPAEEALGQMGTAHFSKHTFKVTPERCTVEFTSTESPFSSWRLVLSHGSFGFVVGGEMLRFRGNSDVGRPAVSRGWIPSDGPEKKELRIPVTELIVPYQPSGEAMEWVGAFSALAELCRPQPESDSH